MLFRDDLPADSGLAGVKTEEDRAEKESAVEIDGVTSDRGTEVPFTRACCLSIAISESKLPTEVTRGACACGEGVGTGSSSNLLETESCSWIPPENSASCLVRRVLTIAMAAAAFFS